MMQIRPMRRKLYQLAFLLQHQQVRLTDQRQGGSRIQGRYRTYIHITKGN